MDALASFDQSTRESALERFRTIQPCFRAGQVGKFYLQTGRNPPCIDGKVVIQFGLAGLAFDLG